MKTYKKVVAVLGLAAVAALMVYSPYQYHSKGKGVLELLSSDKLLNSIDSIEPINFIKTINSYNLIESIKSIKAIKSVKDADSTTDTFSRGVAGAENKNLSAAPNDPLYGEQWALKFTDSYRASGAVKQKKQVKVAVVDSGVDYNHPDLKNRVLKDEGYDFVNGDKDPMDDSWHGTHVAGIIAAEANNNEGITGVVGNLDVKILPVKVLDKDGQGPSNIIAQGILYAVDKGADIINLSVDFDVKDEYIQRALLYAKRRNVLVVVASGNTNSDCDQYSPAGDEGAYTVAAIDRELKKADFSSYGNSVKVAAPGVEILSTVPGGGYEYRDGTSMAAPIVTGIAAMIKAQDQSIGPRTMEKLLNDAAVEVGNSKNENNRVYYGYGAINAYEAVIKALNPPKTAVFQTF